MTVVPIVSLLPLLPPQAATRARHDGMTLCQYPARATGLQVTKLSDINSTPNWAATARLTTNSMYSAMVPRKQRGR
jgi:hypothetical protein